MHRPIALEGATNIRDLGGYEDRPTAAGSAGAGCSGPTGCTA